MGNSLRMASILYCLILVLGCNADNKSVENGFDNSGLHKFSLKKNLQILGFNESSFHETEVFLVLPSIGCDGCITNTENFLINNYRTTKNIKFILTAIKSKKLLKTKLGMDLEHENLILDTLGVFNQGSFNSIYPTIYFVDDQLGVDSVKRISLAEDGLRYISVD